MATDERDRDRDGGNLQPPSWDGNPARWQVFKDEVRLWTLASNARVQYCLAARLVRQLTGSARRIGLSMTDADLSADSEEDPLSGITRLMTRLAALAPADIIRKGAHLNAFFREEKYKRRSGERIAEWISRWDDGLDKLGQDGVDFAATGDLAGWFFLQHSGLSEDRIEMVRASVPMDREFNLPLVKSAVLRLFPNAHERERRASVVPGGWRGASRFPRRSVNEARPLPRSPTFDDVDDVDDGDDDDGDFVDCYEDEDDDGGDYRSYV